MWYCSWLPEGVSIDVLLKRLEEWWLVLAVKTRLLKAGWGGGGGGGGDGVCGSRAGFFPSMMSSRLTWMSFRFSSPWMCINSSLTVTMTTGKKIRNEKNAIHKCHRYGLDPRDTMFYFFWKSNDCGFFSHLKVILIYISPCILILLF